VRVYEPTATTGVQTIKRHGPLACPAGRTRAGDGSYVDTIGFKMASADLTARQGAARSLSSR